MAYQLTKLHYNGLPSLMEEGMTREAWAGKLEHIRETWTQWIGGVPVQDKVPVEIRYIEETQFDDHRRLRIAYPTVYGDEITAYLLIPNEAREEDQGTWPAILALHPTHVSGKDCISTHEGRVNRTYGLELVQRGYVVLAPDALTAGERIYAGHNSFESAPFYEQFPEWTTVGKNIIDHIQSVDVLCSLGYVNADSIGAIGHSFGAYNAYFLAPFDDRIKAIVSSCGVSPFARNDDAGHWGQRASWYSHIPKLSMELANNRVPFEFHEVISLCAPTPMMIYGGQQDHIFPHWVSVGETLIELAKLYKWLEAEEKFVGQLGAGGHDFPPSVRLTAYNFLDQWLK